MGQKKYKHFGLVVDLIKPVIVISYTLLLVACGGGGGSLTPVAKTTTVDIFDGAAIGCTVSTDSISATEVGASSPGKYTFSATLDTGTIVNATGCKDSDTNSELPAMAGVAQPDGVVISPITTLIVAAAVAGDATSAKLAGRSGARSVSASALSLAIANIIKNLSLGSYDPINPATANYVDAAKADSSGTGVSANAMRIGLAISTLLKGVEVSAGSANASTAVAAVSKAIAVSITVVDLTNATAITTIMSVAATASPTVAAALTTASTAVGASVVAISGSTGNISIAIAATTAVSTILNTATATTIADATVIANLTSAVEAAIIVATAAATPTCVLGTATIGGCKI